MLGVYVHFPFCVRRCPYCDFATQVVEDVPHARYADAVLRELDRRLGAGDWSGREVVSIYFGGGTPSLWEATHLGRVIAGIAARLPVRADAEITVEANPGLAESGTLGALREAGANRVSFGTQSFQQRFLDALGRWHSEADSFAAVETARGAGFDNVSLDLIYAVPGQDAAAAAQDAMRAVSCGPDHVSTYCLTLDAKVPMAREVAAGRVRLPSEARSVAIEEAVFAALSEAGFERYEISNHALGGRRAVHNTLYWTGHEYLGLGASASGFYRESDGRGRRWTNLRNGLRWLEAVEAGRDPTQEEEVLAPEVLLAERMFTGLRLKDGLDLDEVARWTGLDAALRHGAVLERLLAEGLIVREGSRVRPTARGLRFHDEVALRFL